MTDHPQHQWHKLGGHRQVAPARVQGERAHQNPSSAEATFQQCGGAIRKFHSRPGIAVGLRHCQRKPTIDIDPCHVGLVRIGKHREDRMGQVNGTKSLKGFRFVWIPDDRSQFGGHQFFFGQRGPDEELFVVGVGVDFIAWEDE